MKNRRTKILVTTLIIIAIISLVLRILTPPQKIVPQPDPIQPVWNGFRLNITKASDVEKLLGKPTSTEKIELGEYYNYPSAYEVLPQQVLIRDGVVALIKQRIAPDAPNYQSLVNSLGKEDFIQYTPFGGEIYPLYVYPSKGLALARDESGDALEIWFFSPTTAEDFKNTFGKENFDTPSEQEPEGIYNPNE